MAAIAFVIAHYFKGTVPIFDSVRILINDHCPFVTVSAPSENCFPFGVTPMAAILLRYISRMRRPQRHEHERGDHGEAGERNLGHGSGIPVTNNNSLTISNFTVEGYVLPCSLFVQRMRTR